MTGSAPWAPSPPAAQSQSSRGAEQPRNGAASTPISTKNVISSNASSPRSNTSDASQPGTTGSPETTLASSISSQPSHLPRDSKRSLGLTPAPISPHRPTVCRPASSAEHQSAHQSHISNQ